MKKYTHEHKTVKEYTDLKENKLIFLDESFQRGTDEESVWQVKEQRKYINSVLEDNAPSPFILVDVDIALEYHTEMGTDDESIEYFTKAKESGYKYVSIDGNNRSIALLNFRKNDVSVPSGEYTLEDDRTVEVSKSKSLYKSLNDKLKQKYDKTELLVTVYTKISKKDCHKLFRTVNDGKALNDQHIRQSHPSRLADYVREKRKQFKESLRLFFTQSEFVGAMRGDKFIAKCISYATYDMIDKKHLDKIYEYPKTASKLIKPNKSDSDFTKVLNNVLNMIKPGLANLKKSENAIFDFFAICYDYKTKNIKIDKQDEFYKLWLETTSKMFASKKDYTYEKKPGEKVTETYKDIVKHPYKNAEQYRRNLILDKIEKVALDQKILIQQEDPDAYFSYDDKVIMWNRQNGICPETNKKIPVSEIADYTKWQGDAIDPKDKGGKHELSNGQLICAEFNNKKSNKLNYKKEENI